MFRGKFVARLIGTSLTMGLLCAAQAFAQTTSVRQAEEGEYVIIGGRIYGAEHGLTFETGSVEVIPGGDPIVIIPGINSVLNEDALDIDENADSSPTSGVVVPGNDSVLNEDALDIDENANISPTSDGGGVMIGPQIYICSSYAVSTEYMQYMYHGVGLAAGDVCDGLRTVAVCFWWERGGVSVNTETCSYATPGGYWGGDWIQGPVMHAWITDSLNPWAPKTIFNYRFTRISPAI